MVCRWRSWFLEGRQNVHDDERSGSPVTATDNAAFAAVPNVVEADRCVTIDEIMIRLPPGIEIRRSSIGTIMSDVLNFRKVCARWVPRLLLENHKQQRMEAARVFLEMHQRDGDQLFSRIVTGDESWVHHSTPETKRQSMEWKKPEESAPKKAKVTISAGKVMAMENFKWEIFTHPPYSPELAPSDFHLYPALKWHLGGKHFANDDEVQAKANYWLRRQDTAWYNSADDGKNSLPLKQTIDGISSMVESDNENLLAQMKETVGNIVEEKLGDIRSVISSKGLSYAQVTQRDHTQKFIEERQRTLNTEATLLAVPLNNEPINNIAQAISTNIKKVTRKRDEEAKHLLKELSMAAELKANSKIFTPKPRDPTIIIKNVSKLTEVNNLIPIICTMNPDLSGLENEVLFRVLFPMKSNTSHHNVVLRVSPRVYQTLRKKDIDMEIQRKIGNWTKFAESISPSDLLDLNSASEHIVNCEDIDNVVNKLTNLVIEAAYSSLDVKHHTSINTTTSKNWWNKELQQLKEHLHYLRNLYYRGGNLNPSIYRAARNKYLRAINRAKKTSWKIFIEENESTNAFGNAYRIFKRLRSADIQVGIPLLNKTAECMREQKMKEMLTAFFPDDDVRLDNEEHTLIRNHIPSFTNREIIFITEKEIKDLCSNLNIRKAPGPDNVSNYMIKHSLLSILPSLVKLFNECLVLGYYPESWKPSVLKIITKPQKADYEAINSYRPISLTSNFSKIFETIIKNKILNYYNHNNLLSHRQHGFTKRKSTITALDKITETILKHKQNELVALIAIDISGAFDNAWWPALIKRMDEDHVPAVLIKIIQSFLNRRRKTSLTFSNTTISKYLSKGCPQGGPLSPLLWNIVLNDLLINFASPNSEIICYADDVSIVCWHKTIEGLKNETERTLNYVIQWCTRNKLKLSPEKTGLIHMHGKQNIPMGTPNFIIKPVDEVKILGIKFSNHRIKSKINFTPHINDILCKINRMKNLLFSLCGKMWGLDAKKRLILYKTLFRPIVTYGSEIWYKFINKRSKQRLNSQQYQILLWVVRAYKTTSSNCIHSLAKIPILTDQIESLIIKYDLANLSKEEINVFRPHAPTIIHNYIESRMAETIANTNETFRKFFPFGIPFYFRPNFYNSQFVTGHGNFGEFLSKIGATDDPSCFCGKENQDSMHLLMECPIFHSYRRKKHLDADGLSRGPLPETDWGEDFERLFLNQIPDEEDEFVESVKKNLNGSRRSIAQNFKEEDGCLFKKNPNPEGRACMLVVPEKKKREIMKEYHNHMSNGHLGIARTMYRIKSKYLWPSMLNDVSKFFKTCHLCQSRKGSNQLPSALLQPIPPANFPFERIGIVFVEPKDNPGQDPLIVHVSRIKPYYERMDEVIHEDVTTSGEGEVQYGERFVSREASEVVTSIEPESLAYRKKWGMEGPVQENFLNWSRIPPSADLGRFKCPLEVFSQDVQDKN
ncbi:hypothetical protein LAZ67_5002657 [Cordylochernes scorpioides]|uniref:Reverse transcriptase domain-containing protein n=1 Tax=Cordylochernes scorpioides TaxID=51811 RepID=A0ABY6KGK9_9ARAC|nr:hypothetical protein LAZ67_5002657 [Cordylochernes scorpioides]